MIAASSRAKIKGVSDAPLNWTIKSFGYKEERTLKSVIDVTESWAAVSWRSWRLSAVFSGRQSKQCMTVIQSVWDERWISVSFDHYKWLHLSCVSAVMSVQNWLMLMILDLVQFSTRNGTQQYYWMDFHGNFHVSWEQTHEFREIWISFKNGSDTKANGQILMERVVLARTERFSKS